MSLQCVSSRIGLVTKMTLKLFVVLVKLSVGLEVSAAGEGGVTLVTFVRLLTAVDSLVYNELAAPGKCLATLLTLVRFFPSVSPGVESQPLLDGKALAAFSAFIWHFSSVTSHVDGERANLDKLFATDPALVGLVPRVLPGVLLHVVLPSEPLTTVTTGELFLFRILRCFILNIL